MRVDKDVNKRDAHDSYWGHDDSDSDFDPSMEGLNLTEKDEVLVVGIDFGTTFSGVAYATASEFLKGTISTISEWPGCGADEGKAPTEIDYDNGITSWGYDIHPDADPVRWFKLLLLKNEDLQDDVKSSEFFLLAKEKVRMEGLQPLDLVADYLRLLWAHTMKMIEKSRGDQFLPALRFHIVISVPAIWKGYARQSMEEAAKMAGLLAPREIGKTRLSFVLEPEAAGMATLAEPEHKELVQAGNVWLILDAGGGTVDLISYKIASTSPITMDEAVEGTGALCGAVLIDNAFQGLCRNRLGRRWTLLSAIGVKEIMKDKWERTYKRQFIPKPDSKEEYVVPIPAEAFVNTGQDDLSQLPHIKKARIYFRQSDIMKAFTESFNKIDELVKEQMGKIKEKGLKLKGIILVGGLGSSPYLYQHLKDQHTKAGLTIIQSLGTKPRTAICRGAVYKGFAEDQLMGTEGDDDDESSMRMKTPYIPAPIQVTSTIARYSLGTVYYTLFDPLKHSRSDPDYEWSADEGDYVINNQMTWYIRKGENMSKLDPVRHPWSRYVKRNHRGSLNDGLYQCASSDPPQRMNDTVKLLCDLKWTPDVEISSLKDFTSADGNRRLKVLEYDIEMVPSGASMDFTFYVNHRKQASHNVKAEYD
ncbi:uncharacterized protein N7511_009182 [Penicillium nucicola]|uniref:uncharacterized protein n=1 Tax=Penicillium nucicola TaxID=1850975 RepID=UPI002545A5CB|nr:uncharacterized protein N7511_009182 [Penicillium nucicola]KAJ5747486.1 hypothetical protein N7511_009182 [Penicillium nucicola]